MSEFFTFHAEFPVSRPNTDPQLISNRLKTDGIVTSRFMLARSMRDFM